MLDKNDIAVVVRSAGERTTRASSFLLSRIFPEKNVVTLASVPFSKAVADSFETARQMKKPWLLCIDADVLVSENGVHALLEHGATCRDDVFEIQGLVLDKFIPVLRPAGNHLYRTRWTEKAAAMIPAEGTSLRPESDMLNRMAEAGHAWMQCDALVGLHDFEQNHSDVFRKSFLQAHKHNHILADAEQYWLKNASRDPDFKIALWGALSGKLYTDTVLVDKRFLQDETLKMLSAIGMREKPGFEPGESLVTYVHESLQQYSAAIQPQLQEKIFARRKWNRVKSNAPAVKPSVNILQRVQRKLGNMFASPGKKNRSVS